MAKIERVSYDDYVKPLDEIQKAHNETVSDMDKLSAQSELLDFYLDPDKDQQSVAMYQDFKRNFNSFVDDFAKNGYNRATGMKALQLHRFYNDKVANILDSLKNKKTEEAAQMSAQEKSNGQTVFTRSAHDTGVDWYLHGQMGYDSQNLDDVHKFAKNEAAAASAREYSDNIAQAVRVLGNNYYHVKKTIGFNNMTAYQIIDGLMADAEKQQMLNGFDNIDDKDNPLGFIRNMRSELQKRGIDKYSPEDQRKLVEAYLTGTYEGLAFKVENEFKDTPEMRKAGRSVTTNKIYTGTTENVDNTEWNENEIAIDSTFNDPSSNKSRDAIVNNINNGKNQYYRPKVDENGHASYGLMTLEEYAESLGKTIKKKPDGTLCIDEIEVTGSIGGGVHKSTKEVPLETSNIGLNYKREINKLKKEFLLSDEDVKQLYDDAPKVLKEASDKVHNMTLAVAEPAYELIVPGDQNGAVLESTWNRAASGGYTGAHTGLQYDPTTGEYSFKDKVDKSTLNKIYDASSDKRKGMLIQLVYAPQTYTGADGHSVKGDLFQVAFCSTEWDEPIFFPLSAFASRSTAEWAKEMYQAQQYQKIMLDKLKAQLNLTDDKKLIEELNEQIRIGNLQQDFFKKSILRKTSESGQIKSNKMFGDIFEADIKTLQPVKYKETRYTPKPSNTNQNADGQAN